MALSYEGVSLFPFAQLKTLLPCSLNSQMCVCLVGGYCVPVCVTVCDPCVDTSACTRACVFVVVLYQQSQIKQSVNYLERAPVAVTEWRRLNIQDQILFSACHIMRQPHQASPAHAGFVRPEAGARRRGWRFATTCATKRSFHPCCYTLLPHESETS